MSSSLVMLMWTGCGNEGDGGTTSASTSSSTSGPTSTGTGGPASSTGGPASSSVQASSSSGAGASGPGCDDIPPFPPGPSNGQCIPGYGAGSGGAGGMGGSGGLGGAGGSGVGGDGTGGSGMGGAGTGGGGTGGAGGAGTGGGGTGGAGGAGTGGNGTGGAGGIPPEFAECNPVSQEGCDFMSGAECDIEASGNFQCFPSGNTEPACAPCNNANGPWCQPGMHCHQDVCRRYCCDDSDCGPSLSCDKTVSTFADVPGQVVGLCLP